MVRRDVEKSVHMFLFERILICCKELGPKTDKKKSSIGFSRNSRKSTVSALSGAGGTIGRVQNTQFALKGGVTINEIEGIVCTSSSLELKIFYKDYDSGDLESFVLRFLNEEYLNLWQTTVERLLEKFRRRSTNSANNKTPMTPVAPKRSERSRLTLTVDTVAGGRESLTPSRTSRPIVTPVSPIKKRGQRHGGMSPPSAAADAPDVPRTRIVSTDNRLSMKRVASEEVLPKTAGEYVGSTPAVTKRETPPALEVMMRVRKEDSSAALVGATSDRDESLQASSAAGSSDMLGNLAQALRDLDVAIQDEFQGMSPAAMESDAPVIPRPISVHISSKDGTGSPVPIVKVKAHHNDDIYVLFLAANIAHRELLTRVREKICDAHGDSELAASVTKMRYHDEDGDFITMGGDDDVRVAMRLALAGGVQTGDSAGRRRVVNLYVS